MRIPLIGVEVANSSELGPSPAIDSNANILLTQAEGPISEYLVDEVDCGDISKEGTVINYWLTDAPNKSWKVLVSKNRVAVWNQYSKNLFGKTKIKAGKASAGHIYFGAIFQISTFYEINRDNVMVFIVSCFRKDGTKSIIGIKSTDADTMRKMAITIHDKVDEWIINDKRKLVDNGSLSENKKAILDKWNNYSNLIWREKDKEVTFTLPCDSFDIVANSKTEAVLRG